MTDAQTQIYTVDLGNGHIADVEGPPNATPEQLQAFISGSGGADDSGQFHAPQQDQGGLVLPDGYVNNGDGTVTDPSGKRSLYAEVTGDHQRESGMVGSAARGAIDGATLGFGDEIHGAASGVGSLLSGGDFSSAYNDTVASDREQARADQAQHPYARIAGELAGGLVLPGVGEGVGLTRSLSAVASDAYRAARLEGFAADEARVIAQRTIARRVAAEGAAYGGTYGAGSADGGPGERLTGALEGAASGGIGGAALGGAGALLADRSYAAQQAARALPLTEGQQTAAAADRLGIEPFAADVGGPTTRRLTAATVQTPLGASPVIKAAQRVGDQAQEARDRIASSVGAALDPEAMGNQGRQGALAYIQSSGQAARGIYNAAEKASQGAAVDPTDALAALDKNIAELSQTPGGAPGVERLQGLRDALAIGPVSVAGIRNMRTVLRQEFIKDGLVGSDLERRVNQVLDGASNDVVNGLKTQGKDDAARYFAQADAAWKTRAETISNVIKPLIGTRDNPKSGEQIAKALTADLQGNQARAVKFIRALPASEGQDVRASIIGALGKGAPGTQNAAGDSFSLNQFLTQWNKIGPTAKRAYFDDETRTALEDLAKVAQGSREAGTYANRSNTGGALGGLATGATGVLGVATLGKALAVQYGAGRLLASPRFARWLARAPRTSLSPSAYADRLTRIARADPGIATEALGFRDALLRSIQQPNLAANPDGDMAEGGGNDR